MPTDTKRKLEIREKLIAALEDVDRPSEVVVADDWPLTMPGLEVDGLGSLSWPLGETQARKLIKLCRQAPYGKGTETVVDTDVRRVWELDPDSFQLTNPKWNGVIDEIVANAQQQLGLDSSKLTAHLYKLLVYEEGSFFLPHRDGEKLDRMVATLVIGLPAVHEGGELIVSHDGRQHEVVFAGAASGHELSFAAFYADCQHEVRPLRSGYRVCLTYNVTLDKRRGTTGITAPSHGGAAAAIAEMLDDWQRAAQSEKLAVTLDHRYTQDGLTIDKLKGVDRARAEVLFDAAEQAGCVAHLALVTLWQCGNAECDYHEYSYGYGRGYHWSDDEDDADFDETTNQYSMGEIFDDSLTANHWSDRQGNKVSLGELRIGEEEIVSAIELTDDEPNQEDFEGYTGNAGMTLERWYHRAAIVIWPRRRHFPILCSAGTAAAVGGLMPLVKQLKRIPKKQRPSKREDCLSFAEAIIDQWQPLDRYMHNAEQDADRATFPALLCELNDPDLFRRFLAEVMPGDSGVQLDKSFAGFCKTLGWKTFEDELTTVVESAAIGRNAKLLEMLCTVRDKNADRIRLCKHLCDRIVVALEQFDSTKSRDHWRHPTIDRAGLLVSLVTAMLAVNAKLSLMSLIEHALSREQYDLTDAHVAAILVLKSRIAKQPKPVAAVTRWLAACRGELENRTASAPEQPRDYRREAKLSCKCADCRAVSRFMADPDERQARFPLAKQRRRHLHQVIDASGCDLTHVTERVGRPYTLVCTKTTASYKSACKIYARDLDNLDRIIAVEKKLAGKKTETAK